jgi:hypothetical protein
MAPRRTNTQNSKSDDNPLTQAAAKLKAQREAAQGTKSKKVNVGTSGTAASDAVNSSDVHPPKFRGKARQSQASPNPDTSQTRTDNGTEAANSNHTAFASHQPLAVIDEEDAPELPIRKPKNVSLTGNKGQTFTVMKRSSKEQNSSTHTTRSEQKQSPYTA